MKMLGGWITSHDEAALSEHCWGAKDRPLPVLLMRDAENCTRAEWTGMMLPGVTRTNEHPPVRRSRGGHTPKG